MTQQTQNLISNGQTREIPTPPGGGSWTFEETSWQWQSNDPTPEQAPAVVADKPSHNNFEQE